ncbi:MAG: HlyD family secretion protein [Bacteroidota bacterium]|nr:HlyD family secretion protein [Bacteroidota bacterium]
MSGNEKIKDRANDDLDQSMDSAPIYKKKSVWIGLLLIIIVIAAGVYWFIGNMGTVSTDDAFIDGNKLSVSSKILGRVVKLYVDERDSVKAGQLIAELDSTDLIAKLNQTKTVLSNVQASIDLAKVNVEKAQIDFNRASAQYKDKVIPKVELDNAQKKYEAVQAEYKIAQSRVLMAMSDIKAIVTNLENTKLYSTINGIVAKRWVMEGDVAQPGQPIFTIFDLKNIWVTAELEETKIKNIQMNDNVEINVDAYPDLKFSGQVYQIGTNTAAQFALIPPSNAAGNFTKITQRVPVKISIKPLHANDQIKFGLLPGMSVEVKIKEKKNG